MHWDHTEGKKKKKIRLQKAEKQLHGYASERSASTDPPQWKHAKKEKSDFFKALWQLSPTISTETAPQAPAPLSSGKPTLLASTIQKGRKAERTNKQTRWFNSMTQHGPGLLSPGDKAYAGTAIARNTLTGIRSSPPGKRGAAELQTILCLLRGFLKTFFFFFKLTDYSTFLADSFVAWRSHLICKHFSVARKWREYPNLSLSPCMMSLLMNGSSTQKFRTVLGGFCWFFSHC